MASKPIVISILANASQAKRELNDTAGAFGSLGQKFGKVGKLASAGLAVAGVAATGLAVSAVKSASDAQQSLGATETVFGRYAKTVVNSSNKAANAYGLSANTYRENANLIGSLFKNQGVSTDQLAGKTDKMIATAADLSATFGGSTTTAVEALGAAFKGEYNQLEKYGISLKQSTVNTEAMRVANVSSVSEFNKLSTAQQTAAKQQATTNLVMKQSKDSVGAFAKESNTLAGQQQRLGAQFDNIKVALGTRLLPILTKVAAFVSKNLPVALNAAKTKFNEFKPTIDSIKNAVSSFLPSLQTLQNTFSTVFGFIANNKAAVGTFAGVILTVAAAVKTWAIAQGILNAVMAVNPFTIVVLAVAALAAGLVYAYKKSDTFRAIVQKAFAVVKVAGSALATAGKAAMSALGKAVSVAGKAISLYLLPARTAFKLLVAGAKAIIPGIKSAFTSAVSFIKGIPGKIKGAFSGAKSLLTGIGGHIVDGLANGIRNAASKVMDAVSGLVNKIPKKIRGIMGINSPSKVTTKLGRFISQGLAKGLFEGSSAVTKSVDKLADLLNDRLPKKIKTQKAASKWYKEHAKDIKAGGKAVLKALANEAKARLEALQAQARAYSNAVRDSAKSYASLSSLQLGDNENLTGGTVKQFLTDRLAAIKNFNTKLYQLKKKGISNELYNQIVQMGVENGTSYAEALSKETPAAIKQLNNLQTQINGASTSLGNSTASAMYGAGINAAAGFYNGMKSLLKKVASMGTSMSKSLVKSLKKALGIRSPSRVMKALGVNTIQGLNIGLDDRVIKAKGQELSKALTTGFKSPQMDAQLVAGYNASGAPQSVTYNITVRVDNTMSEVQMGVAINKAVKAAQKVGAIR